MNKRLIFILLFSGLLGVAYAQKGEKSIAVGPLLSVPLGLGSQGSNLHPGLGAEIIGQYNLSQRSALLLKTTLTSWGIKYRSNGFEAKRLTLLTMQGGGKYQFLPSGFFINGLIGVDIDQLDGFITGSFTLGAGKRLLVKNNRFLDIGMDFVGADAESRLNIKVLFSLFQ